MTGRPAPDLEELAAALRSGPLPGARALLGRIVVSGSGDDAVAIRLTEVEAYDGATDPGSHAYRGRSGRNGSMFADPGTAYVYWHMGLHFCLNVACRPAGQGAAVLLRAGEVVAGQATARRRREANRPAATRPLAERDLARGPGRLTQCLGVTVADDGANLLDPASRVRIDMPAEIGIGAVERGPRVGVGGEGGDPERFAWRLWLPDEPSVSRYRPSPRGENAAGSLP